MTEKTSNLHTVQKLVSHLRVFYAYYFAYFQDRRPENVNERSPIYISCDLKLANFFYNVGSYLADFVNDLFAFKKGLSKSS